MKYLILTLAFFVLPFSTQAASSMIINLFYSNGTLSFNSPAVEVNKDLYTSIIDFQEQSKRSSGSFGLKIIDIYDNILVTKWFDPQPGGSSLSIPHYSTIKKLEIVKKDTGTVVLEQDLKNFNNCNANNICEFEHGENGISCIADCGVSNPNYSKETQQLLNANNGEIKDAQGKLLLREDKPETTFSWAAIIFGVVIIGGIMGYIIIKKRRHA